MQQSVPVLGARYRPPWDASAGLPRPGHRREPRTRASPQVSGLHTSPEPPWAAQRVWVGGAHVPPAAARLAWSSSRSWKRGWPATCHFSVLGSGRRIHTHPFFYLEKISHLEKSCQSQCPRHCLWPSSTPTGRQRPPVRDRSLHVYADPRVRGLRESRPLLPSTRMGIPWAAQNPIPPKAAQPLGLPGTPSPRSRTTCARNSSLPCVFYDPGMF